MWVLIKVLVGYDIIHSNFMPVILIMYFDIVYLMGIMFDFRTASKILGLPVW
jgi:hypothetical protein